GALGGKFPKKWVLAWLYFLRSLCIIALLIAPKTETNILLFAGAMGLLWLGTVPLTSGLVAHMFGVRYLSMLFGITFFSHQVGSFLGVWLGGYLYQATGSYDWVWYGSVILGFVAAALHIPIPEQRPAPATA
ncbi:MAG: MFS transporter, partial [Rhodospirillales bacterium]